MTDSTAPPQPDPFFVDAWSAVGPGWTIREVRGGAEAMVNHREKLALIPPPNSIANRAVRIHEAVHAANGPQKFRHADDEMSGMLEEVRTNAIAWRNGLATQHYHDDIEWLTPQRPNRRLAALDWLQAVTSACAIAEVAAGRPVIRAECPDSLRGYWQRANAVLTRSDRVQLAAVAASMVATPTARRRSQLARHLDGTFPTLPGMVQLQRSAMCCSAGEDGTVGVEKRGETQSGHHRQGQGDSSAGVDRTPGNTHAQPRVQQSHNMTYEEWRKKTEIKPARVEIVDLTTHHGQARSLGISTRPAPTGQAPKYWSHWATDQRIFGKREPGGSLLVDCSGSMRWDFPKLRKGLRTLPATTVAGYCGSDGVGRLWIVARDTRWVDADLSRMGSNNWIDIEGLEWLATQPEPRVWVSDGEINHGLVEYLGTQRAAAVIHELCQQHRIVRADTLEAGLRHIESGRRIASSRSRGLYDHRNANLVVIKSHVPAQPGRTVPSRYSAASGHGLR